MDDARLPGAMRLEDLAMRFEDVAKRLDTLQAEVRGFQTEVRASFQQVDGRFQRVDEQLNAAKIRDEELHRLMTFGLEAREGLRESMERRFDALEKKQDEDIGLLKDVLRHVTGKRART